ncbi:MAG: 5'/3'-nucleotidase SurE [Acidobacteriota bacterium]|jgi:5'-nucleotidase
MATVLLSNDDGYDAPGLQALADALRPLGRVVVVAPDRNRSGSSHAMTLHHPVRVERMGEDRHRVDGTPTDCVNLGIVHLLREARPDLVVSGINCGYNLGDDVTYSGTVAAALEGLLLGVPAIAVSRSSSHPVDYGPAAALARRLAQQVLQHGLPPDTLLNVNVPGGEDHPVRLTRQGRRVYGEGVEERQDPKGRTYYWIGGSPAGARPDSQSDLAAVERGETSVTPLHCDWTNHAALDRIRGWDLPFAGEVG